MTDNKKTGRITYRTSVDDDARKRCATQKLRCCRTTLSAEDGAMTPPRLSHEVKLRDGSIGTVQRRNPDGTWRVWFTEKNWKGDKTALDRFGVAKVNVKLEEMEEV